ncbi:MAG: hypothetical protein LUG52_00535 [Clostridia bacterium]|nr:hypothetical protein [Clostridia bacterium]
MKSYGEQIPIEVQILSVQNQKYVETFFCGNSSIDDYYRIEAAEDNTSVTYLFIDTENDRIISCITIACSAIFTDTDRVDTFSTILSAMEIKYFAVDEAYKHIPYTKNDRMTLSHYIFRYMLNYMNDISHDCIGASKIVLYSVPSAINFYKRNNFKEFGDTMYGDEGYYVDGCLPMYYDLN